MRLAFLYLLLATVVLAIDLPHPTEVPLGLSFDGRVLWLGDARTRELHGYDTQEKRWLPVQMIQTPRLRGFTFLHPVLIGVIPGYIIKINPVIADIVERHPMRINDPVSVAVNKNLLYVYDRETGRLFRYTLPGFAETGSVQLPALEFRGMTWRNDFLWMVAKDGKAYKIQPDTGEVISFLPLPPNSYSITFIDGLLHAANPEGIREVNFISTENYTASDRQTWEAEVDIAFSSLWSETQKKDNPARSVSFSALRMDERVRIINPVIGHSRLRRGEAGFSIDWNDNGSETITLLFRSESWSTIYLFHKANMEQYFQKNEIPDSVLHFTNRRTLRETWSKELAVPLKTWEKERTNSHPVYAVARVQSLGLEKEAQVYFLRELGIPARTAVFLDLRQKSTLELLQFYVPPVGWITVTPEYKLLSPKEFPVSSQYLELYVPESVTARPAPNNAEGAIIPIRQAVRVQSMRVNEVRGE